MGIGLLVIVVMLGALLGLFSRQVLTSADVQPESSQTATTVRAEQEDEEVPHPNAI